MRKLDHRSNFPFWFWTSTLCRPCCHILLVLFQECRWWWWCWCWGWCWYSCRCRCFPARRTCSGIPRTLPPTCRSCSTATSLLPLQLLQLQSQHNAHLHLQSGFFCRPWEALRAFSNVTIHLEAFKDFNKVCESMWGGGLNTSKVY